MKKICILTTGQPSTNPRVVKEADALERGGYDVTVVYCEGWADWATRSDRNMLAGRHWKRHPITWTNRNQRLRQTSRLRYFVGRFFYSLGLPFFFSWAFFRAYPELLKAALQIKADLYIAHYPPALAVAAKAAQHHGTRFAFDAEDFHTKESENSADFLNKKHYEAVEAVEKKCLPSCCYITASSTPIAEAYAAKYGVRMPRVLLNVFDTETALPAIEATGSGSGLNLYWFSQTVGPGRGLEEVVQAMGQTKKSTTLHLQGSVSADYRQTLIRKALQAGLASRQIVFLEPCDSYELVRQASKFDIGLALEQSTPINRDLCVTNKIFGYLMAGLSVMATKTSGQTPIIDLIGRAGWSYRRGDVAALTDRLAFLDQHRDALLDSKRKAREQALRFYNWQTESKKLIETVAGAIGS